MLWVEYREAHAEGYGYSRFCEIYRRWARNLRPSLAWLGVAPSHEGRGVAAGLLVRVAAEARRRGCVKGWVSWETKDGSFGPAKCASNFGGPQEAFDYHVRGW